MTIDMFNCRSNNQNELVYIGQGWNCFLRVAEHTRNESYKKFTHHQCDDHRRKLRTVQIKNHRQYLLKVKKANKELTKKEAFKDLLNQL